MYVANVRRVCPCTTRKTARGHKIWCEWKLNCRVQAGMELNANKKLRYRRGTARCDV